MDIFLWLVFGAVVLSLALAVFWYRRKRDAMQQSQQNNAMLSDFMALEMAMKASQLESYKAMLRNPNPQPQIFVEPIADHNTANKHHRRW